MKRRGMVKTLTEELPKCPVSGTNKEWCKNLIFFAKISICNKLFILKAPNNCSVFLWSRKNEDSGLIFWGGGFSCHTVELQQLWRSYLASHSAEMTNFWIISAQNWRQSLAPPHPMGLLSTLPSSQQQPPRVTKEDQPTQTDASIFDELIPRPGTAAWRTKPCPFSHLTHQNLTLSEPPTPHGNVFFFDRIFQQIIQKSRPPKIRL